MKENTIEILDSVQVVDSHFDLKEILDIDKISILLERFYLATGLANSIVDLEGNILFGIGWKSICTDFHRKNKESAARCLKSDTDLANRLKKREKYAIYTCENGMVDVATPIMIDNKHVANLFIGQFFFNEPDRNYFIEQAEKFGFDKEKYLKALEDCSIYNKESILRHLDFLSELLNVLGESALGKTKQEKMLTEVNISKKYNRSLIEASLDPLVTIGPNGILTDVNAATEKATGFQREKLIGTLFSEYFTDPIKAQQGYQQVFREGRVVDYELELRHVSGTTIPVLYNAAIYKDEQGKIIGIFAAARDITSIRKIENELFFIKNNLELIVAQRTLELKNAQLLLKSSLESPKDMIILSIDKNYNYYNFNQAHHDAMEYAYGKDVKISMNLLETMTSKEDIKKAKKNYDLALSGKSHSTIEKYGDVAVSYYETYYNPIINDNNEIVGATAFARNVTDRITQEEKIKDLNNQLEYRVKERTAQLESANKELEAFSYSVSHDLKAPLRHITGYISLFMDEYMKLIPEEGREYLKNVSISAKNMGELIDGLLQFSRAGKVDMNVTLIDMNEIVHTLIKPIKEQDTKKRIVFKIDSLPKAYGDLEMFKSVWSNLIENAVKFSKNNNCAEITIGTKTQKDDFIYYIKDNGVGFNMLYESKLFNIFQRLHSNEDYEGTGIGLAMVKRILTRHGGKIWAEGKVGEGASFYFSILRRKEKE